MYWGVMTRTDPGCPDTAAILKVFTGLRRALIFATFLEREESATPIYLILVSLL